MWVPPRVLRTSRVGDCAERRTPPPPTEYSEDRDSAEWQGFMQSTQPSGPHCRGRRIAGLQPEPRRPALRKQVQTAIIGGYLERLHTF